MKNYSNKNLHSQIQSIRCQLKDLKEEVFKENIVTYENLLELQSRNLLDAGSKYVIVDHQTLHLIPNTTDRNDIHLTDTSPSVTIGLDLSSFVGGSQLDVTIDGIGAVTIGGIAGVNDWLADFKIELESLGNYIVTYGSLGAYTEVIITRTDYVNGEFFEFDFTGGFTLNATGTIAGGHPQLLIPVEPLILTAISNSEFDTRVKSILYPEDEIYYDITGDSADVDLPVDHRGWIFYRKHYVYDAVRGYHKWVNAPYSLRHCVVRTYHTDVSNLTLDSYDTNVAVLWDTSVSIGTGDDIQTRYGSTRLSLISNGIYTDTFVLYNSSTLSNFKVGSSDEDATLPKLSSNFAVLQKPYADVSLYSSNYSDQYVTGNLTYFGNFRAVSSVDANGKCIGRALIVYPSHYNRKNIVGSGLKEHFVDLFNSDVRSCFIACNFNCGVDRLSNIIAKIPVGTTTTVNVSYLWIRTGIYVRNIIFLLNSGSASAEGLTFDNIQNLIIELNQGFWENAGFYGVSVPGNNAVANTLKPTLKLEDGLFNSCLHGGNGYNMEDVYIEYDVATDTVTYGGTNPNTPISVASGHFDMPLVASYYQGIKVVDTVGGSLSRITLKNAFQHNLKIYNDPTSTQPFTINNSAFIKTVAGDNISVPVGHTAYLQFVSVGVYRVIAVTV